MNGYLLATILCAGCCMVSPGGTITANNGSVTVTETSPGNWDIHVPSGASSLVTLAIANSSMSTPDNFGVITIDNDGTGGVQVITAPGHVIGNIVDIQATMFSPVKLLDMFTGSIGGVRVSNWEGGTVTGSVGAPTTAGKIELVGIGGGNETWNNVQINGGVFGDVTCNGKIIQTAITGDVGSSSNPVTIAVKSHLHLSIGSTLNGHIHNTTDPLAPGAQHFDV